MSEIRKEVPVREAAVMIGKHYVTTLNLIYKGYLRAIKKGGNWYVSLEEIERFNQEGNYEGRRSNEQ